MGFWPANDGLTNPGNSRICKHTGKNINATDGSRTAVTTDFQEGQLVQMDVYNHEGDTDNGIIVGEYTFGQLPPVGVVQALGSDNPNRLVPGSTTNRAGGHMTVCFSGKCKALVRAVSTDITKGLLLTPHATSSSAAGFRWLRQAAPTTVAHMLLTIGNDGAARPCAIALENVTVAETTTASTSKLVDVLMLDWGGLS